MSTTNQAAAPRPTPAKEDQAIADGGKIRLGGMSPAFGRG